MATANALVRATATDVNGNSASDASDAVFTIQGTTSLALASNSNPSVKGESVTLTATITPSAASGTVTFYDGATSLGTASLASGSASLSTSALSVGSHSLSAVYGGAATYLTSTSNTVSQTVNAAATTTSLASDVNPSVKGQSVTLTATVAASSPGSGTPSGSVTFYDGATSLGSATLASGSASISTSALSVGSHSLTAVYAGGTDYTTSTSNTVSQAVNAAATSTSLASSQNPTVVGQSTTLTATVSASSPGSGTPTGSVTFYDGSTSLGTASLSGGAASIGVSSLALGSHSLTAVYAGTSDYTTSTSNTVTQAVNQGSTSTSVASTPNPSVYGQSVAITATVAVSSPGAGTATGSVTFYDGSTSLGTATLSGGSATINTSALSVGSHSLSAVYGGSSDFGGSTSSTSSHTVNQATATASVSSSPNPSKVGQSVTISATVAAVSPGAGTPSGSVEFFDGITSLGTATLSGGSASISTSALALGSHDLTVQYAGDTNFISTTSSISTHTVNSASTTTTVASSPNPSVYGQSVTLTASVTVDSPGAGTASGTKRRKMADLRAFVETRLLSRSDKMLEKIDFAKAHGAAAKPADIRCAGAGIHHAGHASRIGDDPAHRECHDHLRHRRTFRQRPGSNDDGIDGPDAECREHRDDPARSGVGVGHRAGVEEGLNFVRGGDRK